MRGRDIPIVLQDMRALRQAVGTEAIDWLGPEVDTVRAAQWFIPTRMET